MAKTAAKIGKRNVELNFSEYRLIERLLPVLLHRQSYITEDHNE